jgi:tetratricopeptide (TPR) repeat protein
MSSNAQEAVYDAVSEAMRAGDGAAAIDMLEPFLARFPTDEGGLTLLAMSLQLQQRFDDAAAVYRTLTALFPQSVHWTNLGTVLRDAGHTHDAEGAYLKAIDVNSGDSVARMNLGFLYSERGYHGSAARQFLAAHRLAPDEPNARIYAAQSLYAVGDHEGAKSLLEPWVTWPPLNDELATELGTLLIQFGDAEAGARIFERRLRHNSSDQRARVQLAMAYERINRLDDAKRLQELLPPAERIRDPSLRDDIASLHATMALRENDQTEARTLLEQLALSVSPNTQASVAMHFLLAKACERSGDIEATMRALEKAHGMQLDFLRRSIPDLANPDDEQLHIATFSVSAEERSAWPELPSPTSEQSPIFVLGFPRSGTTMLELMLDSHVSLKSMDERAFLQKIVERMSDFGLRYPHDLARLTAAQCDELRSLYWSLTRKIAPLESGQRLVDKNPLSMLRLPLINRLFPSSPIILALRHPCDVVLSCYMQNFSAPSFALLCSTLPRLSRGYVTAMNFWTHHVRLLKPNVLNLRYEDLLFDFAGYSERISQFLGIDEAASMQNFHQNARNKGFISTPSYTQVIEPPHTRSVGRWVNYEAYLQESIQILKPMIEQWGYS